MTMTTKEKRLANTVHWYWNISACSSLLFSTGQTAVKLSGAEAADRAQCDAPDKPIGYWNLLVAFANLKRVIQCACFKSLGSRKGTPKCNLRILTVAQHLPRKWRLVSSSSLQRGHNGSLSMLLLHVNFLHNLLLFISSISVGRGKLQKERHSSMMSLFAVLNNFIKNLMTTKSREYRSALSRE